MNINVIFENWLSNYPAIPLFATYDEQIKTFSERIQWQSESHCLIFWEHEAEKEFLTEIAEDFAKEFNYDIPNYEYIFKD